MKKMKEERHKPKRRIAKPKAFSGNIRCRTTSEIHRQATLFASEKGYTLQAYIESALLRQIAFDRSLTSISLNHDK